MVRVGTSWSWAEFSPCRRYRYALGRRWLSGKRMLVWVLLNPSTADESVNDPTVRRCLDYSKRWNFDALVILNLFAFREKNRAAMKTETDPVGPSNRLAFRKYIAPNQQVLCAWGTDGMHRRQDAQAKKWIEEEGGQLFILRLNQNGTPAHPGRLPKTLNLQVWAP